MYIIICIMCKHFFLFPRNTISRFIYYFKLISVGERLKRVLRYIVFDRLIDEFPCDAPLAEHCIITSTITGKNE